MESTNSAVLRPQGTKQGDFQVEKGSFVSSELTTYVLEISAIFKYIFPLGLIGPFRSI